MAAAPDRSRQYIQRRLNLNQGQIANLGSRAAALEESTRDLVSRPSSFVVAKTITGQYNPEFCLEELRQHDDVTVVPLIASIVENYPTRQPNTTYQLRHSTVANYEDEDFSSSSALHPRFTPTIPRVFSLKADGPVDWSQGLKDGFVTVGNQSLAFLGFIKGPWQPGTEYKFGDNVIVQANYPTFMGMPAGQTLLFVFNCVRDHTSGDPMSYLNFWNLDNTYFDASMNPTIPQSSVSIDDSTTWRLARYQYVRQFWPWNPATNSVQAVLFTDAMEDLRFPVHNNLDSSTYLLANHGNNSVYHSQRQEQGVIVLVDGKLTMWQSNWWKAQQVKSGPAATITFPTGGSNKNFVIDGEFLWARASQHDRQANILLPIDRSIKPFCRIMFLTYSRINENDNLEIVNTTGSHLNDNSNLRQDRPGDHEGLELIFDYARGMWITENT